MAIASPSKPLGVVLIESDAAYRCRLELLVQHSPKSTFRIAAEAGSLQQGLELLESDDVHIVLLDLAMPDGYGVDAFDQVHAAAPELPIIVLCEEAEEDIALQTV